MLDDADDRLVGGGRQGGLCPEGPVLTRNGEGMRVALVISALGPGGAEKAISALADRWVRAGWRVDLVTFGAADDVPFHPLDPRVRLHPLGLPPRRDAPLRAARLALHRALRLRAALRAIRPTVVVSFLTRTNILTLLASVGSDVPVIVSERNNPRAQKVGPGWRVLRRLLYPRAFAVTALTREALDCYPAAVRARGAVIPNAFDVPPATDAPADPPTIVAVGRLVEQKGFDLLLRAFARVADGACAGWRLVIWGEGPARGDLERQRDALGLASRVSLPGVTPRPYCWTGDASVFVLSSRFEGLANVLGEALAAGLPAIATDCDWGPREFIADGTNGMLVPAGDVEALAAALGRVASDPVLRARLGATARVSMVRFAPDRVLARWDEIVAAAVDDRPVRRATARVSILAASTWTAAALSSATTSMLLGPAI